MQVVPSALVRAPELVLTLAVPVAANPRVLERPAAVKAVHWQVVSWSASTAAYVLEWEHPNAAVAVKVRELVVPSDLESGYPNDCRLLL